MSNLRFLACIAIMALSACSNEISEDDMSPPNQRQKGWANGGPLFVGQTDPSFDFQQDFGNAGYYTIQLGVDAPGGSSFDAVASIKWKVNGQTIKRQISLAQGSSISGMCETVDVKVVDNSNGLLGAVQGTEYRATVSAIPGTRAGTFLPPILRAIASNPQGVGAALSNSGYGQQTIAPGQTFDYVIPNDAGATSFELTVSPNEIPVPAGYDPRNISITQKNAAVVLKQYPGQDQAEFDSIYPSVTVITIQNLDTTNTYKITGTWGIDG